ncbi:MAG: hypothetical protein EKK39_12775 [Sphingobacteriales bacterium]|uniref:hypothetical protein n=1 Tax=Hydrotalea flava TaxID=714549 RepID=UPI00082D16E2|nr:hypothetical protein [Hydrotalea flava]RTL48208.1 MAG: hypothetical protein EKK39_12775 [Sphingobacteriales bacterium]
MANVKLSAAELELVTNIPVILTKNRIIAAANTVLGEACSCYQILLQQAKDIPDAVKQISPKIYKGENYQGLPWVMLDYPRYFTRHDELAIRSYFWWGHYFSITLQLSGKFIQAYAHKLQQLPVAQPGWFLLTDEDKWQHVIDYNNAIPLADVALSTLMERPFIKVVRKIPLQQWADAPAFFQDAFEALMKNVLN